MLSAPNSYVEFTLRDYLAKMQEEMTNDTLTFCFEEEDYLVIKEEAYPNPKASSMPITFIDIGLRLLIKKKQESIYVNNNRDFVLYYNEGFAKEQTNLTRTPTNIGGNTLNKDTQFIFTFLNSQTPIYDQIISVVKS